MVRSGAGDPEDEPQWLALIVRAGVSSGLRQPLAALCAAAILIQPSRFGGFVLWPLGATASKRGPRGPGPTWRVATDRHRRWIVLTPLTHSCQVDRNCDREIAGLVIAGLVSTWIPRIALLPLMLAAEFTDLDEVTGFLR